MANKMSRLSRFASKPARLPLNWLVSRHAVDATKEFRFKSQRYPLCPNCSLSRFALVDEGRVAEPTEGKNSLTNEDNKSRSAVWECPSCEFEVKTRFADIKSIQDWCVRNANEVYRNSDFQKQTREAFENSKADDATLGQLSTPYLLMLSAYYLSIFAAGVMAVRFLYAIYAFALYRSMIYWVVGSPVFIVVFLAIAALFNYLMWQSRAKLAGKPTQSIPEWYRSHKPFSIPRFEVTPQSSIQKSIRVYMLGCYAALTVAAVMGMSFLYASYNLILFYMLNTLLFTGGALFIALVFNYRAWQAYSNNIYTGNAKSDFHWWMQAHTWYSKPKDIGLPPSSPDINQSTDV